MEKPLKRIYLDYAASTPLDAEVMRAMRPYFSERYGNPSSLHAFGQQAMAAVDRTRETIAKAIGADFHELAFTGSATEANNLAIRGIARGIMNNELRIRDKVENDSIIHNSKFIIPRIIVSSIEHESVLETARALEKEGVEVVYLPVDREGIVELKTLEALLNERTILVSVMQTNNETGSVQPIAEISKIIRGFRARSVSPFGLSPQRRPSLSHRGSAEHPLPYYPLFHVDAVQSFHYFRCDVNTLGVDLLTLSAHKIYGPKGIGALYIRDLKTKTYNLKPMITGGGQEFGLRSGTENVPAIVGFGKAVELAETGRSAEYARLKTLKDYFWRRLKSLVPGAELNGPEGARAAPHILNVAFPGMSAHDYLIEFDMAGIAVSSGSACSARASKPSHVLSAMRIPHERILRSIRFSFGRPTIKRELDEVLRRMKERKIFRTK